MTLQTCKTRKLLIPIACTCSFESRTPVTKGLRWRGSVPAGDSKRRAVLAVRLPLCAEAQDARFGNLSRRSYRPGQVTSRICSQPTRAWTRSVGVEGRTRKAHFRGDDAGVGDSTRSPILTYPGSFQFRAPE